MTELFVNQSYLCQQLIEINKKYDLCSFVDIDFIDLYDLQNYNNIDLPIIKRKITTKYYSLALKYHPDKYISNEDTIINIKNCFINVDEVQNGQFLSFINDIYELLINLIDEEPESLVNIIQGNTNEVLNKYDLNTDHNILKRRFNNETQKLSMKIDKNDEYLEKIIEEMKCNLIIDKKMDKNEMDIKKNEEIEKRNQFKLEEVFTEAQINEMKDLRENNLEKFNLVFNTTFEDHKDIIIDSNNDYEQIFECNDIQPYNFLDKQNIMIHSSLSTTI